MKAHPQFEAAWQQFAAGSVAAAFEQSARELLGSYASAKSTQDQWISSARMSVRPTMQRIRDEVSLGHYYLADIRAGRFTANDLHTDQHLAGDELELMAQLFEILKDDVNLDACVHPAPEKYFAPLDLDTDESAAVSQSEQTPPPLQQRMHSYFAAANLSSIA